MSGNGARQEGGGEEEGVACGQTQKKTWKQAARRREFSAVRAERCCHSSLQPMTMDGLKPQAHDQETDMLK